MNSDILSKKAQILAKAWTDPVFKQHLLANPHEVVTREFGIDLPAGLAVKVLEDTADTVHLVLVDPADLLDEEKAGPKAAILAKAWAEPDFKKALLADPAAALMKAFGAKVLPGMRLRAVEQTSDHVYAVLPVRPATLSDSDLEQVAGGMSQGNKKLLEDAAITGAVAIACPEGYGTVAAGFGLARAYEDRGTLAHDGSVAGKAVGKESVKVGKAIGHAAKKVFHGW